MTQTYFVVQFILGGKTRYYHSDAPDMLSRIPEEAERFNHFSRAVRAALTYQEVKPMASLTILRKTITTEVVHARAGVIGV